MKLAGRLYDVPGHVEVRETFSSVCPSCYADNLNTTCPAGPELDPTGRT